MNARNLLSVVCVALVPLLAGCPQEPEPVVPPAPPEIVSFTATPSTVNAGETVVLSWKVNGADAIRLERLGAGTVIDSAAAEGETSVTLERDEVFVLSARSEGGQDARSLRVDVGTAENLMVLAAIPQQVRAGETVTLVYSAPGAASVSLTDNAGQPIALSEGETGTLLLQPQFDTTWTLKAGDREVQATATVTPAVFAVEAKLLDVPTRKVQLSWRAGGAEVVSVHAAGRGEIFTGDTRGLVAEGSLVDEGVSLDLPADTFQTYTVYVGEGDSRAERSASIRIGGGVAIDEFSVPQYAKENGAIALEWRTRGAARLEIWADGAKLHEVMNAAEMSRGGYFPNSPAVETTYELRAYDAKGEVVTASGTTRPIGPAVLVDFTADKATVAAGGEPVTLTWEVTNARRVRIEAGWLNGTNQIWNARHIVYEAVGPDAEKGSVVVYPNEMNAMGYRLYADNTVGDSITMQQKNVTVSAATSAPTWPEQLPSLSSGPFPQAVLKPTAISTVVGVEGFPNLVKNAPGERFVDIRGKGQRFEFGMTDDHRYQYLALPEKLPMVAFGSRLLNRSHVSVSMNGWMYFSSSATGTSGPEDNDRGLPAKQFSSNDPVFAPFFDDLVPTPEMDIRFYVDGLGPDYRVIVQWSDVEKKDSPGSRLTFQAQVHPSGKVVFAYQRLDGLRTADATIGVQNGAATVALLAPDQPKPGDTYTFFGRTTEPGAFEVPSTGYIGRVWMQDGGFMEVLVKPETLPVNNSSTGNVAFAITEVNFASGAGVTDGEWIEITNFTTSEYNLRGWALDFGKGHRHVLETDLLLPPQGQLLLAQTADAGDGLPVDYVYGTAFRMTPGQGSVSLVSGAYSYASIEWTLDGGSGPGVSVRRQHRVQDSYLVFPSSTYSLDCKGTTPYGTKGQLGTPKLPDNGCYYRYTGPQSGTFLPLRLRTSSNPLTITNPRGEGFNVRLPFEVRVGELTSNELWINSNGFLTLTPVTCTITTTGCFNSNSSSLSSTSAPVGEVAVFWDALSGSSAIPRIFWEAFDPDTNPESGDEYVIVSWENMSIHTTTTGATSDLNFQVTLTPHGDVVYQFGSMITTGGTSSFQNQRTGSSATSWIEDSTGRIGVAANVNTTGGIQPNSRHVFTWAP